MKKLLDKTIIGYKINHPDEKSEKEITDIFEKVASGEELE